MVAAVDGFTHDLAALMIQILDWNVYMGELVDHNSIYKSPNVGAVIWLETSFSADFVLQLALDALMVSVCLSSSICFFILVVVFRIWFALDQNV